MMHDNFCQCCGMPMGNTDEVYGTNLDGSKSNDYCKYCFENGEFSFKGTMEEMVEICIPYVLENNEDMNEATARKMMLEWFPTLKYWKQ